VGPTKQGVLAPSPDASYDNRVCSRPGLPPLPVSHRQTTQIKEYKNLGNAAYKTGDFSTSETYYTTALQTLQNEFSDSLSFYSHNLVVSLYLNRAQVRLKTGDYKGCITDSSYVIQQALSDIDITSEEVKKALSKRSEASEGLEKYSEALADHRRLQQLGAEKASAGISRCLKALETPVEMQQPIDFDPFAAGNVTHSRAASQAYVTIVLIKGYLSTNHLIQMSLRLLTRL
jgi:tetratricopeptide (TPR) repeat protein